MTLQSEIYDELRERLKATQEAAERMAARGERARASEEFADGDVPPQGWAAHGDDYQPNADEIEALLTALRQLRELLPEELQDQLRETIRNVLLLIRGILDLALDRLEHGELVAPRERTTDEAEDIPIL